MRTARHRGFSLIEVMAVVVIMGLMLTLVLPNFSVVQNSLLRGEAVSVAGAIEFARQRAVMTGKPHRLLIDLEGGSYRIEWWITDDEDPEVAPLSPQTAPSGHPMVNLTPPSIGNRSYRPIPTRHGNDAWLDDDVFFAGIETEQGWVAVGEVAVVFERDGTTDAAELVIANHHESKYVLDIRPLIDHVGIYDEE